MEFNFNSYPYSSRRGVVFSNKSMVATSNPSAALAGIEILRKGGNAIEAALAAAISMPVVEPTCNGLGADLFAIISYKNKLYGINGSGRSPKKISIQALREKSYEDMPFFGVDSVNTPGAVGAWFEIYNKFGKLPLKEIFEPAINYAKNGYALSPKVAKLWDDEVNKYKNLKDICGLEEFFKVFSDKGKAPKAGDIVKNDNLKNTLEEILETEGKSFYSGDLARKISTSVKDLGGFLDIDDLKAYKPLWVDPISTKYKGYDIWEMPPNGHGVSVLMALNILNKLTLTDREDPKTLHKIIEAIKIAMTDGKTYISDPSFMKKRVDELLSDEYAEKRKKLIGTCAKNYKNILPISPSTVYMATADSEGNMVSLIQSNYNGFGSGIVVPTTGIALNNRLANFSFDSNSVNALSGGKLPYHTIIPGFISKDNEAIGPFGIMGGFMQPQAHVQVLTNMIDFNLNPQAALDAPRFLWTGDKNVEIEMDYGNYMINTLKEFGHNMIIRSDYTDMGRGQIILRLENGTYVGATEKRTDGYIGIY